MNARIKQLRACLGYTQKEFAERLGVKSNVICQYEIGRTTPGDSTISLICKVFNVNHEWLLNGTGDMFAGPTLLSLDECAYANKLTDAELSIMRSFMNLDPKVRQSVYDICRILMTGADANDCI